MANAKISWGNKIVVQHNVFKAQRELRKPEKYRRQNFYREKWRGGEVEIRPDLRAGKELDRFFFNFIEEFSGAGLTRKQAIGRASSVATSAIRRLLKKPRGVLKSNTPTDTGKLKSSVGTFVVNKVKKKRGRAEIVGKYGYDYRKAGRLPRGRIVSLEYGGEHIPNPSGMFGKAHRSISRGNVVRAFIDQAHLAAKKSAQRRNKRLAPFTYRARP